MVAAKGRWADTEEDLAFESKQRQEKEERRQRKLAEKARRQQQQQAATAQQAPDTNDARPSKRRKLTPDPSTDSNTAAAGSPTPPAEPKLLRFPVREYAPCRSVAGFEPLNDIEEGTYGWVSRAREVRSGRVVALKKLKFEPRDRGGVPVTGLREIQILRNCENRNIVRLEEVVVGEDGDKLDNSIYLVMEFIEHDLKVILQDMPEPFLASEVKRLLLQLGAGVAYLHEHWILHRDLKTSNLLLNNRGQLKIADFGMARYTSDPPPPKLTQLVVTLWYRAPELLLGARSYDGAVDMWSVGCIFGELLTREPLLQGANEVEQMTRTFELCGVPTEATWPGFRQLPNARTLRLPKATAAAAAADDNGGAGIRAKFPFLTAAGCELLSSLLALDPLQRPTAAEMLQHEYFQQDPRPKQESMFPTFPSKAGQERRQRHEPHAPGRGAHAPELRDVDFTGIFAGRDKEERGAGFSLRMV